MSLTIFDSTTNKLQKYEPKNKECIKWYVCGPTVYDDSHLGHARTYMMNDLLVKITKHLGYNVETLMNITDIDDKILKRSKETYGTEEDFKKLTQLFTERFTEDMNSLGISPPDNVEPISLHFDKMIQYIQQLIDKGFAYEELGNEKRQKGKSVYFDTTNYNKQFKSYVFEKAKDQGEFEDAHLKYKKKGQDFALWKGVNPDEVGWDSPWGKGRPGWHTECATLINQFYGNQLSIHTGGIDLCFPHHENEMKQLTASNMEEVSNTYFLHIGHLHIDGQKMAKSKKNFTTIRQLLGDGDKEQQYKRAQGIRYMFLQHHYREPMEFSIAHYEQAQQQLHLMQHFMESIRLKIEEWNGKWLAHRFNNEVLLYVKELNEQLHKLQYNVMNYLSTDYKINDIVKDMTMYTQNVSKYIKENTYYDVNYLKKIYKYYTNVFELLGIYFKHDVKTEKEGEFMNIITKIRDIVREQAKETKNKELWKLSDTIRNEMVKPLGYQIEDKKNDPSVWKRI